MKWFKLNEEMINLEHVSCFKIADEGGGKGKIISFFFGVNHKATLRYCNDTFTSELFNILIRRIESASIVIDVLHETKLIEASYPNDTK